MKIPGAVASAIGDATQRPFQLLRATPVGGGDLNQVCRLQGVDGSLYFLKLNDARQHAMYVAEAAGLKSLAATDTIRVPRAITHGIADGLSFLVLEHLPLGGHGDARTLGIQLAALHRHTAERFGYQQDNFIGTSPQPNSWTDDWPSFWREHRIGFQLQLAASNGYDGELQRLGEKLMVALPAFFADYTPQPSLLHGDLWGGNHGFLADGTPTIFDPACYYGDRECDLAMTALFGGYPAEFYAAYQTAWPLDPGYAKRRELYNLYHILNHANLFGGSYARQAERMISALLAP
ncbi:MAG: fructosamine kinase family protein [Gammaproteobacteria bacterium]|nr:fructosamine kinase family protein [Gammaproteobacteria bacterium]MBU1446763.1 fructosamine kinase family protein [Gammaproteobacteria bacterium]